MYKNKIIMKGKGLILRVDHKCVCVFVTHVCDLILLFFSEGKMFEE